jgi:hypothetical protein
MTIFKGFLRKKVLKKEKKVKTDKYGKYRMRITIVK